MTETPTQHTITAAEAAVAVAINETVLPAMYTAMDELIDSIGEANVPRELLVRCKKLLPAWCFHSFSKGAANGA